MMNLAVMAVHTHTNSTRSKMYTIVPMVMRPGNLCGWTDSRVAKPPVLIVNVNHAQVKLLFIPVSKSNMEIQVARYALSQSLLECYLTVYTLGSHIRDSPAVSWSAMHHLAFHVVRAIPDCRSVTEIAISVIVIILCLGFSSSKPHGSG
jgi:hypothetical protein